MPSGQEVATLHPSRNIIYISSLSLFFGLVIARIPRIPTSTPLCTAEVLVAQKHKQEKKER